MAEKKIASAVKKLSIRFQDGTGTPQTYTPDNVVKFSILPNLTRGYESQEILVQSGGAVSIYSVLSALSGSGDLTCEFVLRDVSNTTDITLVEILRQLFEPLDAFENGLSTAVYVSTNPLTDTSHLMLDLVLTWNDIGGAGVDQTWTSAVYVKALSIAADGQYFKVSCTFGVVEAWTKA